MLTDILKFLIPSVVHDDWDIVGTWVPAVMPINALTGNKFVNAVAIQVREMKRMCLAERIVDLYFIIKKITFFIDTLGKPCKDAVIMPITPKQIILSITIDIADQYRARKPFGPALLMELPWTCIGITFWPFIPTRTDHDITSSIIV